MDHVVYLDTRAREWEKIMGGSKKMLVRGAAGRKMPYGRVFKGDKLYFIRNNGEGLVLGRADVIRVIESGKMEHQQSIDMLDTYSAELDLSPEQVKRWGAKRYLILIEISQTEEITPFSIDRSDFNNMDDWLAVEDIDKVKKQL